MSRARIILWLASVLTIGCNAQSSPPGTLFTVREFIPGRPGGPTALEPPSAWLSPAATCFAHEGRSYCVGAWNRRLRGCGDPGCRFLVDSDSARMESGDWRSVVRALPLRQDNILRTALGLVASEPLRENAQPDALGRCARDGDAYACGLFARRIEAPGAHERSSVHAIGGRLCGVRAGRVECAAQGSATWSTFAEDTLGSAVASLTVSSTRLCALSLRGVMTCVDPAGAMVATSPAGVRAMAVSEQEQCVLVAEDQVICRRDEPGSAGWRPRFRAPNGARQVELRRGAVHLCVQFALGEDWQLWCWGDASYGRLGVPQRTWIAAPTERALPEPIAEVFVGRAHACARSVGGRVYCWGANEHGQAAPLAMDVERVPLANRAVSVDSSGPLNAAVATDVRVGEDWSCWTESGRRRCLPERALAAESAADRSAAPSCAAWIERAAQHGFAPRSIACAVGHACFVRDARVYCLGNNESFQVAPGEVSATTPVLTFSLQRDRARAIEL